MNLANAALLIAAVLGLAAQARTLKDGTNSDRATVAIVDVVALLAVFLVGATSWAHTQVIGNVEMAHMSVADKVLVALFAAGAASAAWETLGAVKNIGAPQPTKTQQDAIDQGALASMERWANLNGAHGETPEQS